MIEIHLIWAQDSNGGIGKKGSLPWHIPEDLKNFKKLTRNSTIIMGRNTWESLPIKPLPKRRNIVISSHNITDVEHYNSIDACLDKLTKDYIKKIFVIGGARIYKEFIYRSHELHITFIHLATEGVDTFFPLPLEKIEQMFTKKIEYSLGGNAIYTNWKKI